MFPFFCFSAVELCAALIISLLDELLQPTFRMLLLLLFCHFFLSFFLLLLAYYALFLHRQQPTNEPTNRRTFQLRSYCLHPLSILLSIFSTLSNEHKIYTHVHTKPMMQRHNKKHDHQWSWF